MALCFPPPLALHIGSLVFKLAHYIVIANGSGHSSLAYRILVLVLGFNSWPLFLELWLVLLVLVLKPALWVFGLDSFFLVLDPSFWIDISCNQWFLALPSTLVLSFLISQIHSLFFILVLDSLVLQWTLHSYILILIHYVWLLTNFLVLPWVLAYLSQIILFFKVRRYFNQVILLIFQICI